MRALPRRDRRRESQKAFARHDMRSSTPRLAAQCNKLDLQTDSEHSSGKVDSGDLGCRTNTPTTHFYGKYSCRALAEFPINDVWAVLRAARYAVGDLPVSFLKTRLNCDND